ncbi:MAG: RagB/SusD family nutrient uptake outer membrane protein [Bacteroidaceae bacterium]|nr:RagB/SusD family nutrient uptake outer membrane protein [Bacteroidaceae bacterium]
MKKQRIILVAVTALMLASCSDSFFELSPNDQVTVDQIYQTENDFKMAVNGCYSKLQTQMDYYIELCEYRSDDLYLNAPTSGTQDRYDIDQFKENAANGILNDLWANFSNGVYRCNMVIDRIDDASFDETKKKQYKAEAMFIRSYTYFNMYRAWGCVPITKKVVTVSEALNIGRATEDEMFDIICGDLKTIVDENMLPTKYTGSDIGRVTLGAAKALLAKAYLTFKKPREAADVLSTLIDSYSLMPNIADVFNVDNKMNDEIIFAIRYNKEVVGEGHGAWYSITNLSDETNRTATLNNLYSADDKRSAMLEYVQVPGVKVCLMRKFFDTRDATTLQYGPDNIILRYADVLLMYAEALNEVQYNGSQTSPAMAALNAVHTRAGLAEIDIATLPDQATFRKAVMLERQKEFPYEGQRWFDSVRLGGAQDAAAAEGHTIQQYQMLFPIPTTELERINNESLMWQNPGY